MTTSVKTFGATHIENLRVQATIVMKNHQTYLDRVVCFDMAQSCAATFNGDFGAIVKLDRELNTSNRFVA